MVRYIILIAVIVGTTISAWVLKIGSRRKWSVDWEGKWTKVR